MGLFGKKDKNKDDGGDDANRNALFGSKKAKQPAASDNPYARNAPASDPYTQAKAKAYGGQQQQDDGGYQQPPVGGGYASNNRYGGNENPYGGDNKQNSYGGDNKQNPYGGDNRYGGGNKQGGSNPYGEANDNSNRYGASSGGSGQGAGYGADKYGAQGGYGGDKYGSTGGPTGGPAGGAPPAQKSRYGTGGYGGLGPADDESRDALFGGAKDRVQKQQPAQQPGGYGSAPTPYSQTTQQPGGAYDTGGYNAPAPAPGPVYQDRQLTAEEEEEEDVTATKQQIRFMKQSDVSSTRNALRIAQQAEETGRDTLARLGVQGDHILNTEMNLDKAHQQNRIAEERAKELKTLTGSMFAVHVANPFTASSRRAARDQAVIDKHLDARTDREAVRRNEYEANARMQKTFKEVGAGDPNHGKPRGPNLAERAKFQFEADSDDEEMENEIDSNLDALSGAAGRLHLLAKATNEELDLQNRHLDRIGEKSDKVDIGLAANKAKLERIR